MKVFVNSETVDIQASHLAALLEELAFEGDWLATAVNSEVISAQQRKTYLLQEGDKIEILSPMQGG
ncbi:sulfur carrier protein ThiS [Bartonella tamiae]|uniref:Thiamine biosynthesis protein ThiS n=1 Tax=Bartonella tamiae Th239 TaxID=1094558 RepID=J0ZPS7_9HYPH|nr:sulfur carrier protein ThiS [Bartonella tamiae]EJF90603.1 thiamine biosynthesis protein ThiS [Bartonella tamiae Th239]EJF94019.1 thiamine biosynthesis protein ThiS [Bartonella tamiae Th307]